MSYREVIEYKNYGYIKVNLNKIMAKYEMTPYKLAMVTGLKYDTITNLRDEVITKVSFDVLAKLCYTLKCDVGDILKYVEK